MLRKSESARRHDLGWPSELTQTNSLLEPELEHAPAQEPLPLRDLRTRAELCDVSSQLSTALVSLRNELAQEQAALERSLTLLSDLEIVEGGLKRRQDQLQARRDRDMTSDEAIA